MQLLQLQLFYTKPNHINASIWKISSCIQSYTNEYPPCFGPKLLTNILLMMMFEFILGSKPVTSPPLSLLHLENHSNCTLMITTLKILWWCWLKVAFTNKFYSSKHSCAQHDLSWALQEKTLCSLVLTYPIAIQRVCRVAFRFPSTFTACPQKSIYIQRIFLQEVPDLQVF